ncbi:glycosyltransferase family 2 protein [Paenibacillus methanolicus]|uniref:GT2 family glycosyltransferase n=1 Tax=Paenibacillus methanolicus TaxID=582686 RepID=A0A5S5BSG0_9BACL|nr:glycosyltransferase [Paenibacillus methanolicus]TYP70121.1 GT2 family glycosyltransferase [Paenibacillus methanolicus]
MVDVGVVMPVYKQVPAFLEAAIQSILTQTLREFRFVIVIDGAPEMETLAREFVGSDPRVEIIRHDVNRGVAAALNTGFTHLDNDDRLLYWTWASSDNVYHPAFLEVLRGALHRGPKTLGLAYSSFNSIDNKGNRVLDGKGLLAQRAYQSQPKEALLDGSIIGVSFMYKAEFARKIEGYRLEPVEDYEYWLRLCEQCEIRFVPVELVDYRVDSTLSVSATLKSVHQHRRWRYAYHLARMEARQRRGIAPEVTLIYPLRSAGQDEIDRLENVYEQVFSNYHMHVLDLSVNMSVTRKLSEISHPTTAFRAFPNASWQAALRVFLRGVATPYTMVLDSRLFPEPMDLRILVQQLNRTGGDVLSDFYTDDRQVGYRYPGDGRSVTDFAGELFRTPALAKLTGVH